MASTAAIEALGPDEIARRLSGSRAEVAAFIRAAAEAGSAEAQARLGQMLLDGDGIAADPAQGFRWFLRAAQAGHLEAANMVGRCHDLGWGTPVDKGKAALWFRLAAARGLVWGLYNYATALALGAGVPEDRAAALALFRRAAAAGNAKAMNFVGSFHEDGWAVAQDPAEAARCYEAAAEGGDFRGAFNHGRMLAVAGRIDDALAWIAQGWRTGNPRFRGQVEHWLSDCDEPALRMLGGRLAGGMA